MSAKPKKPQAEIFPPLIEAGPKAVISASGVTPTIPPCPAGNSSQGMKTPEVVAWWFKYFPEEAAVKYAGLTLD